MSSCLTDMKTKPIISRSAYKVQGGFLKDNMKKITLLFPGSYMDYRKIDEDMQEEYRAAVETGLYHTILFNYDEWVAGGSLRMTEREASSETYCAVYRGWMLKPEDYLRLFEELSDKGIRL